MKDANATTAGMRIVEARTGTPIRDWLTDAYLSRGLTLAETAAEAGCDAATVSRWLRRFGITARAIGYTKSARPSA